MSTCGSCGALMGKNRFGEKDCPKCYSENFVGMSSGSRKSFSQKTQGQKREDEPVEILSEESLPIEEDIEEK